MPSTSKKKATSMAKKSTKATSRKASKATPRKAAATGEASAVTVASSSKLLRGSTDERSFALKAGDLSVSAEREVTRVTEVERSSQAQSLQAGIDRLVLDGYISTQDATELRAIIGQMLGASREPADVPRAATRVGRLYQRMMSSGRASPVALAIAGAFNASLAMSRPSSDAPRMSAMMRMRARSSSVTAVVGGMIRGIIGGVVGGSLGAGIGAALGVTAGAALGFRNEEAM